MLPLRHFPLIIVPKWMFLALEDFGENSVLIGYGRVNKRARIVCII